MTQRLSILAEIPLPTDLIDSRKVELPFLEIAEKFRTEVNAMATKMKIRGVTVTSRCVKTKDTSKPRKAKVATADPAAEAAATTIAQALGGEAAPANKWGKSPLAMQLAAADTVGDEAEVGKAE